MVGTLCERAGAKAYVTGQLMRAGQGYEIKLEVKRCGDRSRLAREIEPAAHTNLAGMREAMFGNLEEAQKDAEEALKTAPDSKDVRALAALIFARRAMKSKRRK